MTLARLSLSLSSRPEQLLREAKQLRSGGTCFSPGQRLTGCANVHESTLPTSTTKKSVIPTNGRDLQFGFWAAQRVSAAISPALTGALAPGVTQ